MLKSHLSQRDKLDKSLKEEILARNEEMVISEKVFFFNIAIK
jgi:hypothetical protein